MYAVQNQIDLSFRGIKLLSQLIWILFNEIFSGGSIWGKGILKSRLEATFQDHRL